MPEYCAFLVPGGFALSLAIIGFFWLFLERRQVFKGNKQTAQRSAKA
jgi:hypothetical protein